MVKLLYGNPENAVESSIQPSLEEIMEQREQWIEENNRRVEIEVKYHERNANPICFVTVDSNGNSELTII